MQPVTSIQFSWADLEGVAQVSGDRNPLHLSPEYARRSPYGEPVVFGVLGGLTALAHFEDRPDVHVAELTLDFAGAMLTEIPYRLEIKHATEKSTARLYDGKRLLLKLTIKFQKGEPHPAPIGNCPFAIAEAHPLTAEQIRTGDMVTGTYAPALTQFQEWVQAKKLTRKGLNELQLAALMWASYSVGMELPGKQALFSKLKLRFQPPLGWPSGSLAYAASVENLDDRFNLVQISSDLRVGITPIGQVTIQAFIRPNSPTVSHQSLGAILPPSKRLNGKVALVIGGSRGLGAAISGVLAQQGCTTVVNFLRSEAEALRLQTTLKAAAGEVALFQGDASALAWCEAALHKIEAAYGRLDYLICNACPPILPMWLEPSAVARINSYIEKSLALMSTPMAAFLEILSAHRGWNIAISSIYATEQAPADLPQYIAAKSAIEGLVKAASLEYEKVHHCIVRPPKLLTDQTNTPLSRQGAIAPEVVAAELVKTLMDSQVPKPLSILERFPSAPVRRH